MSNAIQLTVVNEHGFVTHNFACRLLSKFHLKDTDNWSSQGFTPTPDHILFPNANDPWYRATRIVKDKLYHYEPGLEYDRLTDIEIDQRLKTLDDDYN